ncbi:hypothetical protein FHW36_10222 [Chitinophaga polysaccharea]|uniref:Uncharacterized protein n=1 Tax=Chitinophaga polysaccharea TaxID=1293035 RepID=A0A561PVY2_9BACT|nr:hypothetical protein [Chitinophaga polysaccharea]TWF42267.1 hypothetical protein FHW36_10222 [Chitinophaga polysaccharea]
MANDNKYWNLEDFVDSLVVELDKTRETLAIKAINKPLTYTVKDLAIDLNIFPTFDGDTIRFITAQPGQQGASKVNIQLGSITDQQVRATTKISGLKNDTKIEDIGVDEKTRNKLRKMGVNSVDDLQQVEKRQVDIQRASDNEIDYKTLANQIQKSRRNMTPPKVNGVSLSLDDNKRPYLHVKGENFTLDPRYPPVTVINNQLAEVMEFNTHEVKILLDKQHITQHESELIMTFDPYTLVKMNIRI